MGNLKRSWSTISAYRRASSCALLLVYVVLCGCRLLRSKAVDIEIRDVGNRTQSTNNNNGARLPFQICF